VEAGTYDASVTPGGLMHCIGKAIQLVPGLADLPLEETWVGMRPTTPDKGPVVGRTEWEDLFLAGGYWRNGVLLAPKGGQLVGDLVLNHGNYYDGSENGGRLEDEADELIIKTFAWERFLDEKGGKALGANARYAASMHPVQRRSSGMGVSAAVGTELGFYSGAEAAVEERRKDRESLFGNVDGDGDRDDAFERAAKLGMGDASAFSFDDKPLDRTDAFGRGWDDEEEMGSVVASDDDDDDDDDDEFSDIEMDATESEGISTASSIATTKNSIKEGSSPPSTTFDGYTSIQSANSRSTRSEELEIMKRARIANRISTSKIDESKIGVRRRPVNTAEDNTDSNATNDDVGNDDISKIYAQIKDNKRTVNGEVEMMQDTAEESRPDPGFRIYHVGHETREQREVPPYTSPQEMEDMIAAENKEIENRVDNNNDDR